MDFGNSEVLSRCRYCGLNYSYIGEDPEYCGNKLCKKAFNKDVRRVQGTSGITAVEAITFNNPVQKKRSAKKQ